MACADLDIVLAVLALLLRPAQQYSSQTSLPNALNISSTRLQALARRWPNLREHNVELIDLVAGDLPNLPIETAEVQFQFYKKAGDKPDSGGDLGPSFVHLDSLAASTLSTFQILETAISTYGVPYDDQFDLLCRIRTARALGPGMEEDRRKLVQIGLLSTAIYVHTHPEASATTSLFLYEPELVAHAAELLRTDRGVPMDIQTAAIAALDGVSRYRGKIHEVLTAVNAGVNHGLLMALFRKTVTELASELCTIPATFVDALLSFVTFIAANAAGGNMVVSAGLVPLLIQLIENPLPNRLPVVSKAIVVIDNILYGYTNAFQLFVNARGVDITVDRIKVSALRRCVHQ